MIGSCPIRQGSSRLLQGEFENVCAEDRRNSTGADYLKHAVRLPGQGAGPKAAGRNAPPSCFLLKSFTFVTLPSSNEQAMPAQIPSLIGIAQDRSAPLWRSCPCLDSAPNSQADPSSKSEEYLSALTVGRLLRSRTI